MCGRYVYETPFNSVLRFFSCSSLSDRSFLVLSVHLRSGLPLFFTPSISITISLTYRAHIPLLFSMHAHTISSYFPALSWRIVIFFHSRCPSNYIIPYSVQLGDSTHPLKHVEQINTHYINANGLIMPRPLTMTKHCEK